MNATNKHSSMEQWYLIQLKPNAYNVAKQNLNRQGFTTFLPLIDVTRRNNCKFTVSTRPLFPGYMFVNIENVQVAMNKVNNTIGVSKMLSFDGRPKALPKQLVFELFKRCDSEGKIIAPEYLGTGDMVKVLNGPFANFVANVESIESTKRVWVILKILGQHTRTRMPLDSLQLTT